jgi:uncharacterized protein (TIGR00290 family)
MKNAICSWSGGKDCCYAMMEAIKMGYNPVVLINMMDVDGITSRSHGLPVHLLRKQAISMNIELLTIPTSSIEYETNFVNALKKAKEDYQLQAIIYGDIDLIAHREWQERICHIVGLEPVLPLWERKRSEIATEILENGIENIVVSCNETMGQKYLGKVYNKEMIKELENQGICPCGEDGEFHSFVINSPLHQSKIKITENSFRFENGFHFIDWKS